MSIKESLKESRSIHGIAIALGLVLSSIILSYGICQFKSADRFVSVKGFSERQVKADLALWPIRFTAAGNDLNEIYGQISSRQKAIIDFLKSKGFSTEEIHLDQPSVTDKLAQAYNDNFNVTTSKRFVAEGTVLVRSKNVDLTKESLQQISSLVGKGVTLSSGASVDYVFTGLDKIKPEMIEEATKQARVAAERFAKNSGSHVGGIKTAYQGTFSIEPVHFYTQELKNVRVVIDIDYLIK